MGTDKHRFKNFLSHWHIRRLREKTSASICVYLWLISFLALTHTTNAQVQPVYDRGAVGLMQLLKRLNTTASVLMIGAHPDDEDTALLAYLARGENARTAYLSLTRGDGGQNIIGPELGEALGVIRTEELLQARRLDGAGQFFTRAYDYGFSKTLEEAKQKWDEKIILCDAVRVIRNFRPLVVISQFSGTPADGHGQHQFAGYISPLAVRAAADPAQCTDAGAAWQVKKFYVRHRGPGEPTLRLNTGKYDSLLGRSYFEIAMEARSQHKSQEQGVLELKGDQFSSLDLSEGSTKVTSIFEGLETNGESSSAARALNEFDIEEPSAILPHLVQGLAAPGLSENARTLFGEAIKLAAGVQIDALADRETYAAGERIAIGVKIFHGNDTGVTVREAKLIAPEGWKIEKGEAPQANTSGFFRRETGDHEAYFNVTVPEDERPTQPYWLIDERPGDMFRWFGNSVTKPVQPAALKAQVTLEILGKTLTYDVPIEYRFADDIRGEIRRNVDVVPKVTVEMDQSLMIVPYSAKPQTKQVVMTVTNHSQQAVNGTAALSFDSNAGWKFVPSSKSFELKRTGEKTAIKFDVTIPAKTKPGSYQIYGHATIGETVANLTMKTIAYPHIQTHRFYRRAVVETKVVDLKTSPVKVGYITGSGDRVADAIRQMGFSVETISESELANGDLSKYGTIVVGIRAYQVRPDLVANNQRLIDFANAGGTLIVQYQLRGYTQQNLTPFPAQQGPRVSDELAKVTMLDASHPLLNAPNKITEKDFEGWVQERNLYNFSTMDAKYAGLLESHDPNEPENKGGLVVADVGKGKYIYCSYSLFRQLPAGVPGAYRLLANMLAY
ncbi:MAG: PIG-L family deacetylase [Pyrinomonadaceae bacterium]